MAMKVGAVTLVVVVLAMAVVMVKQSEGLGCNDIGPTVSQCAPYAEGKVGAPSAGCCSAVRQLDQKATTTADRRLVCHCFKQIASKFPGVKDAALAALPGKCGVTSPIGSSPRNDMPTRAFITVDQPFVVEMRFDPAWLGTAPAPMGQP
ncbi:Bifunctional inhibitor/plant lipid transfer protein/seed storage helical domain [Dillenia turbinata]|uniref:Non-specific lipid-transfer protein n=1 Tax=Dillenia turbinata TaxID=194707 RepID=A0AAN8UPH2_9MAGN